MTETEKPDRAPTGPASAAVGSAPAPISVTVIGGYLGAGKTTLVNHILRTADQRVAVLVNDFGDVNIDAELIESADGDTISLANGCICCSLVDGFAAALTTIREIDPRPERLVIEASGVADPASVAAYGHTPGLELDAVVVLVDAETIRKRSKDRYVGDTVLAQLRSANIVVLNKLDLVDEQTAADTRVWLRTVAPEAVLQDARQSAVHPSLLFGVPDLPSVEVSPVAAARDNGSHDHNGHDDANAHGAGGAEDIFESWTWTDAAPVAREAIEALMAGLPEDVVRAKGLFLVAENAAVGDTPSGDTPTGNSEARPMVLQRVGLRWTLRPLAASRPQPERSTCVFIGIRGSIDADWLDKQLRS